MTINFQMKVITVITNGYEVGRDARYEVLSPFAKASRLRVLLRPGKRRGKFVTAKGHYKDFLLFLDTHSVYHTKIAKITD